MNNFRNFLCSLCCGEADNDHRVTMPNSKLRFNRLTSEEIKELSITDEGLIIILELFKLELVPQINNMFELVQDLK